MPVHGMSGAPVFLRITLYLDMSTSANSVPWSVSWVAPFVSSWATGSARVMVGRTYSKLNVCSSFVCPAADTTSGRAE